jgi:restriction system protein
MLGKKSSHAETCLAGSFIGTDFGIIQDLSSKLPDEWREFNKHFIPIFLKARPDKTKIGAGLACGMLWTVSKGIKIGDLVLCPDGSGRSRVGEVTGNYEHHPGEILPHRQPVRWLNQTIDRCDLSTPLKNSALGKTYDIYEEDGECVGQQYPTDTGPVDILAISKDKKKLLVVELKKGRASDVVVGQTLRYMGYVQEELAEDGQQVSGVIIALEDDQRIRRALMAVSSISFYRYQISFKLVKV